MSRDVAFAWKSFVGGILFGIGGMVAILSGFWVTAAVRDKPIAVAIVDPAENAVPEYKSDLSLLSHLAYRERRSRNQLYVLGKIKNNGRVAWKSIEIQAEIFNQGVYVDECHAYIKTLLPGETDNFKITCGDCAEDTIPDYDKIQLKVASAYAR